MKTLQTEIRGQFGSPSTTRFLRALPVFQVDPSMPKRFARLLADLDRVEGDQSNSALSGKRTT